MITSAPLTFTLSLLPLEAVHLPDPIASVLDPSVLRYSSATCEIGLVQRQGEVKSKKPNSFVVWDDS